jgi:hypothetical protein
MSYEKDLQIYELREIDCLWIGGLLGYFVYDHYEAQDFAIAVNRGFAPEPAIEANQVKHSYWVETPVDDDPDCDETYFEPCKSEAKGAIAVTYVEI